MTIYDAFEQAHKRFIADPTALSDSDLQALAAVDAAFAERARAKRAGYVQDRTDAERKVLAAPLSRAEHLADLQDVIRPMLAMMRRRIAAIESRVLELEAQRATVAAPHSIEDLVL